MRKPTKAVFSMSIVILLLIRWPLIFSQPLWLFKFILYHFSRAYLLHLRILCHTFLPPFNWCSQYNFLLCFVLLFRFVTLPLYGVFSPLSLTSSSLWLLPKQMEGSFSLTSPAAFTTLLTSMLHLLFLALVLLTHSLSFHFSTMSPSSFFVCVRVLLISLPFIPSVLFSLFSITQLSLT